MQTILPRTSPLEVGTAIRIAANYLSENDLVYGHGTDSAIDDAAWLILESSGLSPLEQPDYTKIMSSDSIERCEHLLLRRVRERIPVAYLVGRTWFAGLEFKVDNRALVPRSPISELIINGFNEVIDTQRPFRVLDLCTGGGCIAVAIAHYFPQATLVATDLSFDALALAAENIERYQLQNRITLMQGDLFAPIDARFDLIVSNPPYVDASDIASMGAEFLCEPSLGLASGVDGLDLTRKIIAEVADYLTAEGVVIVEVGNSAEALDHAFPHLPFIWFEFASGGDGVFALSRDNLISKSS